MNAPKFSSRSARIVAALASVCTTVLLVVAVVSLSDTTGVVPQMAATTAVTILA